jgi:hypothetical protein
VYDGDDDGSAEEDYSTEVVMQDPHYTNTMDEHHFSHDFGMDNSRLPNCPEEAARLAKGKHAVRPVKESRQSSSFSARVIFPSLVNAAQIAFEEENPGLSANPSSSGIEGRIEQTRAAINDQLKGKGKDISEGKLPLN